ncbi:MAG: hypothetical protein H0X66_05520 [Verrucomicrobia bacterium]|nr:hypothetical protein [Verrucomicrobiota bacterium]
MACLPTEILGIAALDDAAKPALPELARLLLGWNDSVENAPERRIHPAGT